MTVNLDFQTLASSFCLQNSLFTYKGSPRDGLDICGKVGAIVTSSGIGSEVLLFLYVQGALCSSFKNLLGEEVIGSYYTAQVGLELVTSFLPSHS